MGVHNNFRITTSVKQLKAESLSSSFIRSIVYYLSESLVTQKALAER